MHSSLKKTKPRNARKLDLPNNRTCLFDRITIFLLYIKYITRLLERSECLLFLHSSQELQPSQQMKCFAAWRWFNQPTAITHPRKLTRLEVTTSGWLYTRTRCTCSTRPLTETRLMPASSEMRSWTSSRNCSTPRTPLQTPNAPRSANSAQLSQARLGQYTRTRSLLVLSSRGQRPKG